jgi:hypothetical protein
MIPSVVVYAPMDGKFRIIRPEILRFAQNDVSERHPESQRYEGSQIISGAAA